MMIKETKKLCKWSNVDTDFLILFSPTNLNFLTIDIIPNFCGILGAVVYNELIFWTSNHIFMSLEFKEPRNIVEDCKNCCWNDIVC